MTIYRNSAEGGTDGTNATSGNTGGASGDSLGINVVGGTIVFDDDITPAHGTFSYLITPASGSNLAALFPSSDFTATDRAHLSFYLRLTAAPAANATLCLLRNTSDTNAASLLLRTDRRIAVNNAAGSGLGNSGVAGTMAVETWYRIEFRVIVDTSTTGTIEAAIYLGDDTESPLWTFSSSTENAGTADLAHARLGRLSSAADTTPFSIDSIQVLSDTDATGLGVAWPTDTNASAEVAAATATAPFDASGGGTSLELQSSSPILATAVAHDATVTAVTSGALSEAATGSAAALNGSTIIGPTGSATTATAAALDATVSLDYRIITPPVTRVHRPAPPRSSHAQRRINQHFGSIRQPVTLLRTNGVWTAVTTPSSSQVAAADLVLQGGHWHRVTPAVLAEIQAAGIAVIEQD